MNVPHVKTYNDYSEGLMSRTSMVYCRFKRRRATRPRLYFAVRRCEDSVGVFARRSSRLSYRILVIIRCVLEKSNEEFVVFVDSDAFINRDWLDQAIEKMEKEK